MVPILVYLFLGLIQGIGEWLPISSEGMLTIVGLAYGLDFSLALRIAIWMHIGTLFAVFVYYREEWKRILFDWTHSIPERRFLVLTTIGTAITGLPIKILLLDIIDPKLLTVLGYLLIGVSLLITSALIYYSRSMEENKILDLHDLSPGQEILIGMAQGFTIIPGISRSGTTVSALLLNKVNPEESFRGSFLMSVPAVLGGTFLDLLDILQAPADNNSLSLMGLVFGIIVAFLGGLLTIQALLQFARKVNFALVTLILGILLIFIGLLSI
ncbi:MAG: undecaprenyl-diphosphate phosphatase [Methanobacteriota archaeon]|nr:MAG: undecaprenyl-diphosphate phosphatase [Euryarchaeota archaeon]